MIRYQILKRKGRKESSRGSFLCCMFRCAWKHLDKPVSSRTLERYGLQTEAGAHWPLLLPCCGRHGIRQVKGVIEAFSLWHPSGFLPYSFPDSPWAVEAGRVASWHRPGDEGPQARSCPLPRTGALQIRAEEPGTHANWSGYQLLVVEMSCEGLWRWAWETPYVAGGHPASLIVIFPVFWSSIFLSFWGIPAKMILVYTLIPVKPWPLLVLMGNLLKWNILIENYRCILFALWSVRPDSSENIN